MASKPKQINIGDMSLQQLGQIKQQLDGEVELLTNSIQQLQSARNKYSESSDCVEKHSTFKESTELLVPLTGSMYVPGTIGHTDRFIVDIGTGYFVQKDPATAQDFFKRKVTFLQEQIDKYVKIAQEKAALRDNILEALQYKSQMAHAQQQAAATSAAK